MDYHRLWLCCINQEGRAARSANFVYSNEVRHTDMAAYVGMSVTIHTRLVIILLRWADACMCVPAGPRREGGGCKTHSQMSSSLAPGNLNTSSAPDPSANTLKVSMSWLKCSPKPLLTHGQSYSEKSCKE